MGGHFLSKNYPDGNSGFSLIETLVAVSVLVIISGLIAPGFNFFKKQSTLDAAAQEILQTIRLAQSKTLASEGDSNFGVYFETHRFILFKGTSYPGNTDYDEIHNLDPSLEISSVSLGGSVNYAVFERLTGTTANYGSLVVRQISDTSKNKTVYLDQSGIVSLATNLSSDTTRQKDSRHVEVLFSQNVKNATTLALNFTADLVTENINFQTYLDAGKTEFSWEGSVTVDGQTQKIKIHTHYLSDTAALFCIHRDRRENTKALNLTLDGQNLISYSASGITSNGSSVWAGAPQIK